MASGEKGRPPIIVVVLAVDDGGAAPVVEAEVLELLPAPAAAVEVVLEAAPVEAEEEEGAQGFGMGSLVGAAWRLVLPVGF